MPTSALSLRMANIFSICRQPANCADNAQIGNLMDVTYGFNLSVGNNGNVMQFTNNRNSARSLSFAYDSLKRLPTAQTALPVVPTASARDSVMILGEIFSVLEDYPGILAAHKKPFPQRQLKTRSVLQIMMLQAMRLQFLPWGAIPMMPKIAS
jgi:hypothetical protein